jgi:hypothetical protein
MAAHARDRLHDCAIIRPFSVEDVTGNQHMPSVMLTGDPADRIDGIETGFVQRSAHIGFKPPERLAQLPVR